MPHPIDLDAIVRDAPHPPASLAGPGAVARDAADTSRRAAARGFATERWAIIDLLEVLPDPYPNGITARDIVRERICPSTNQAGSRLQELRGRGRFPRLLWRVVHSDTGKLVTRDGCAVHMPVDATLPDDWAWEPEPVVRLCDCCGQRVRQAPAAADGTVDGDPS